MENVEAGDVVKTFYQIRKAKTGQPEPQGWARHGAVKAAGVFLEWCANQEIEDPIGFVKWRLEAAVSAGHPIGLNSLSNKTFAERWKSWGEGGALEASQAAKLQRAAGTIREQAVKALRILTPGMEAAKFAQQDAPELCLARIDRTGGFDPRSRYCPNCPLAVRCAAALYREHGFDVVSLRSGRLHVLPAEVAAAAVR